VGPANIAFSCHVVVDDQLLSRTAAVAEKIRHNLWHGFRIDHPVLQFESATCGNGGLLCELSCAPDNGAASHDTDESPAQP
jgi:cobalt-zinc-cadmium efflux system protein